MKKSDHDIDNLFKAHFDDFEVPVDNKVALWRRISPDRTNRRFMIFMFLGLMTAASMLLAWSIDEIDHNRKGAGGGSEEAIQYLINEKASVEHGDPSYELGQRIEKILEKIDQVEQEKADRVIQIENAKKGGNVLRNKLKTEDPLYFIEKARQHSLITYEGVSSTESGRKAKEDDVETLLGLEDEQPNSKSKSKVNMMLSPLSALGIDNLGDEADVTEFFSYNKLVCSTTGKSNGVEGNLFVDGYVSGGLPIDHVSLQSSTQDQVDYLDLWNERVQSLSSFSGGLMIGYQFGSGLEISSGAEYQRIEAQYQTTQRVTEIIQVYDPMAFFFIDDAGNTVWVADSVSAVSVYDRTTSIANRSSLLSVPFQLSYPLLQKGPWQLRAVGGGSFNFSIEHKGVFLREDQQVVPLDDTSVTTFMAPRIGLSIEAGLQLSTLFGERMELYLSPRYRYNRQSYLVRSEALSVSRDFIGIRVGAKYHFY